MNRKHFPTPMLAVVGLALRVRLPCRAAHALFELRWHKDVDYDYFCEHYERLQGELGLLLPSHFADRYGGRPTLASDLRGTRYDKATKQCKGALLIPGSRFEYD